jgi:hypothetical protein
VRVWRGLASEGAGRTVAQSPVLAGRASSPRTLRVTVRGSQKLRFAVKSGSRWVNVGGWVVTPVNRRVIRLGMTCRGPASSSARFDRLTIRG